MAHFLFFISKCTEQWSAFPGKHFALSIAGNFTLEEANQYIIQLLDNVFAPWYPFFHHDVQIHFLYFYANPGDQVMQVIQPYLDYFSVADYVDTQEWADARYEVDYLVRAYAGEGFSRIVLGSLIHSCTHLLVLPRNKAPKFLYISRQL